MLSLQIIFLSGVRRAAAIHTTSSASNCAYNAQAAARVTLLFILPHLFGSNEGLRKVKIGFPFLEHQHVARIQFIRRTAVASPMPLMPDHHTDTSDENEQRQCRICLDGVNAEPELGRLIRPCLCKGSIRVSIFLLELAARTCCSSPHLSSWSTLNVSNVGVRLPLQIVHSIPVRNAITSIGSPGLVLSALQQTQVRSNTNRWLCIPVLVVV